MTRGSISLGTGCHANAILYRRNALFIVTSAIDLFLCLLRLQNKGMVHASDNGRNIRLIV